MGEVTVLKGRQNLKDIIKGIKEVHPEFAPDYDAICHYYLGSSDYYTGRNIYDFLKANVRYNEEDIDVQSLRSPSCIIATGKSIGADCKNYSLFTGGVLDALNRAGEDIDWCYRFAAYPDSNHVFVVINPETDNEIWVDPVMSSYNYKGNRPLSYEDKKFSDMALIKMSGVANGVYAAPYGELYTPLKTDGTSTTDALAYGLLKMNLESEAAAEIASGVLVPGSARWQRYNTTIDNVDKKIARFEREPNYNFGKSMQQKISGGIISAIYGSEQLKTMQQALPAIALDFLYLYIPINDSPSFYKRWCPQMVHNYMPQVPTIVTHKRNLAGQTSWHWGEWGGFHPEDDVYPLLYAIVTQQLGMTPEAFWSAALKLPITKQDNGVFAGLMSASGNDVDPLATQLNAKVKTAIANAGSNSNYGVYVKLILAGVKLVFGGLINKLEMLYPVEQFTPAVSDWAGTAYNPFPNGFPPPVGMFSPTYVPGPVVDNTDPLNPTPGGGSSGLVFLLMGVAAMIAIKKNKHQRA